jgi:hypothetical protein
VINTPAYCGAELMMAAKSFVEHALGENFTAKNVATNEAGYSN